MFVPVKRNLGQDGMKKRQRKTAKEDTHIYLEQDLRRWIADSAKRNMRSITQEISYRLRQCQEREMEMEIGL